MSFSEKKGFWAGYTVDQTSIDVIIFFWIWIKLLKFDDTMVDMNIDLGNIIYLNNFKTFKWLAHLTNFSFNIVYQILIYYLNISFIWNLSGDNYRHIHGKWVSIL